MDELDLIGRYFHDHRYVAYARAFGIASLEKHQVAGADVGKLDSFAEFSHAVAGMRQREAEIAHHVKDEAGAIEARRCHAGASVRCSEELFRVIDDLVYLVGVFADRGVDRQHRERILCGEQSRRSERIRSLLRMHKGRREKRNES